MSDLRNAWLILVGKDGCLDVLEISGDLSVGSERVAINGKVDRRAAVGRDLLFEKDGTPKPDAEEQINAELGKVTPQLLIQAYAIAAESVVTRLGNRTCPGCRGVGYVPHRARRCTRCNGTGKI